MKKNWTLKKTENDFFVLEDELRNLYFAVRTYELFGIRSPYTGVTDYSPSFELLEKVEKKTMFSGNLMNLSMTRLRTFILLKTQKTLVFSSSIYNVIYAFLHRKNKIAQY